MTNKFEQFKTWLRETYEEEFDNGNIDHLTKMAIFFAGWEAATGENTD